MERHLTQIAERQEGLITLNQFEHAVPARHRRRRLIEAGTLIRIAPKTYRISGAPTTHRQQLRAGLLSLGHESWVSFEAAAQLHGLDRSDPDAVEFTVPRGNFVNNSPFCVHTTNRIPLIDRVEVDGIRCTSATRTILDLALARRPEQRIEAAIDSAVRLGLSAPHAIARRLDTLRGRGRWGCRLIENLVLDSGGHSPLERRFLTLCRQAGIDRPLTQAIHHKNNRFVARVDFLFAPQGVVVEVSGQHGHSSPTERQRDAQRRNELQDLGRRVFEYTYADVMRSPDMVIRTLLQRLRDEIG
jgi:hypothetical protein